MNRKLKLALAAMLGFSTACTTVKNTPRQSDSQDRQTESDTIAPADFPQRVVVMYGVRPVVPQQDAAMPEAPASEAQESSEAGTPAEK